MLAASPQDLFELAQLDLKKIIHPNNQKYE